MNATLVQEYDKRTAGLREVISNYNKEPVQLSRIDKSKDCFEYEGRMVGHNALKDLLNIFSIKQNLINEIRDDQEQWRPLHAALSNIKNDRIVTAVVNNNGKEPYIARFFDEKIDEAEALKLEPGIDLMRGYLETTDRDLTIRNLEFNPETLQIDLRVQDKTTNIDVFGDGEDNWNPGFGIGYGERKTSVAPYYLRLVCTNGMTAAHEIIQRYFNTREMKQSSFNKLITQVIERDVVQVCKVNAKRLQGNNASLREFFAAKNIMRSDNKDLQLDYFDDKEIQEAYKPFGIRYRNKRWLSSANSNVNAYEFFNRLTHAASHQPRLKDSTRMSLNALASGLFFKGPDLAFQAPNPFGRN